MEYICKHFFFTERSKRDPVLQSHKTEHKRKLSKNMMVLWCVLFSSYVWHSWEDQILLITRLGGVSKLLWISLYSGLLWLIPGQIDGASIILKEHCYNIQGFTNLNQSNKIHRTSFLKIAWIWVRATEQQQKKATGIGIRLVKAICPTNKSKELTKFNLLS